MELKALVYCLEYSRLEIACRTPERRPVTALEDSQLHRLVREAYFYGEVAEGRATIQDGLCGEATSRTEADNSCGGCSVIALWAQLGSKFVYYM